MKVLILTLRGMGALGLLPPAGVVAIWVISRAGLWVLPHVTAILWGAIAVVLLILALMVYRIVYEHMHPGWAMAPRWQIERASHVWRRSLHWDGTLGEDPSGEAPEMEASPGAEFVGYAPVPVPRVRGTERVRGPRLASRQPRFQPSSDT